MHDDAPDAGAAWEAEGRRLAPLLDDVAAALVTGHDVAAASHLALGIAAAQSARRRVAVGDLSGEAAPLVRLVASQITDDDPHGLSDVLRYGASMNRVARQVDEEGRLYVVPVGSEPLDPAHLVEPRWSRIADGFRDVGALLLLVAPSTQPELPALAARLDATVAADHGADAQTLPKLRATARTPDDALPAAARRPRLSSTALAPAERRNPVPLVVGGLLLVAGLAWAGMVVGRGGPAERPAADPVPVAPTAAAAPAAPAAGAGAADSLAPADSAPPAPAAAADSAEPVAVANPGDLASAAAFAVRLFDVPTEGGARTVYVRRPLDLLAATLAPVTTPDGEVAWRFAAGAYQRQSDAQAVLARVRTIALVPPGAGEVVRLPYAVQVESSVPRDSLRPVLNRFVGDGFAAYALQQRNGRSNIYVGAFAEPDEARALLARLQGAGLPAALVVRTGRPL